MITSNPIPFDTIDQLRALAQTSDNAILHRRYNEARFVHFSEWEQATIHIQTHYQTPVGLHAYPLTKEIMQAWEHAVLPFKGSAAFAHLLSIKENVQLITTSTGIGGIRKERMIKAVCQYIIDTPALDYKFIQTVRNIERYGIRAAFDINTLNCSDKFIQKLADEIRKKYANIFEYNVIPFIGTPNEESARAECIAIREQIPERYVGDLLQEIISNGYSGARKKKHIWQFWNATRLLATLNPRVWNILLRAAGVDAVFDDAGEGMIHPNEPEQIVFLTPSAYQVEWTLPNFAKCGLPIREHNQRLGELCGMGINKLKNIIVEERPERMKQELQRVLSEEREAMEYSVPEEDRPFWISNKMEYMREIAKIRAMRSIIESHCSHLSDDEVTEVYGIITRYVK